MRYCLVPESNSSYFCNDKITTGDNHASPATPDACSGEQQRFEVTGQSRQKPAASDRVKKYRESLASGSSRAVWAT